MLIKCPKCQAVYKIGDDVIKDGGLKMHCQQCDATFRAYKKDALPEDFDEEQNKKNVAKMFENATTENNALFEDEKLPAPSKIRIMPVVRYKQSINYVLILLLLFLSVAVLYLARFDVVRYAPNLESIYQKFNIQSVYLGQGLQFSNLSMFQEDKDSISKLKITGIINNVSKYFVDVPPVKVVLYNKNGNKILDTTHYLPIKRVMAYGRFSFEIVITNPNPGQKNVHITFANDL